MLTFIPSLTFVLWLLRLLGAGLLVVEIYCLVSVGSKSKLPKLEESSQPFLSSCLLVDEESSSEQMIMVAQATPAFNKFMDDWKNQIEVSQWQA